MTQRNINEKGIFSLAPFHEKAVLQQAVVPKTRSSNVFL